MYSPRLLQFFREPKCVGLLPPPAASVEVMNPVCGDILQLSVEWRDGIVAKSGFLAKGCTASIAAGAALAEWAEGKTREQVAAMTPAGIEALLDGLPNESKHAAQLAADAARALGKR
ncbi:MAG: iron-sulfur cluster assembly scaffold protein [Acidobacteria bacterium]|nr:iron-sulfur cluster assembly scaffold protein [Acidobacteriota bacterium]